VLIRHLWQLKAAVLLHGCLIHAVPLSLFYRQALKVNCAHHPKTLIWNGDFKSSKKIQIVKKMN